MMDIAIQYDPATNSFDIALDGADVATDDTLKTAIMICLFTDRRAEDDDEIPDGTDNRRGWWDDPTLGSRLWLLSRAKAVPETLTDARKYAIEALQRLIDEGVITTVDVTAEWVRPHVLGLIVLADEQEFRFNYPLEAA